MRRMVWALPLLAACSSPVMRDGEEPGAAPGVGEARVVVYRLSGRNAGRSYPVYAWDSLKGLAENGSFFEFRCPAGEQTFLMLGVRDSVVQTNVEEGRTYYLRADTGIGFLTLRPILRPGDAADLEGLRRREIVPENTADLIDENWDRVAGLLGAPPANPPEGPPAPAPTPPPSETPKNGE